MNIYRTKQFLAAALLSLAVFTACEKTPVGGGEEPKPEVSKDFQVIFANGSGNPSQTYVQGVADVSKGSITFAGKGYELRSSRTSRMFFSDDLKTMYALNYTVGTVDEMKYNGGDQFTLTKTLDASIPLGAKALRFSKVESGVGSVHYVSSKAKFDDKKVYLGHEMFVAAGLIDLDKMELKEGYKDKLQVSFSPEMTAQGYFVGRIDAPVVSGNKIYYGASVSKWNASTGKKEDTQITTTLVLDYPSLNNPSFIFPDFQGGATNGYRTPTQHKNEAGEILQMLSSNEGNTYIMKIVGGQYSTAFKYDLSSLLKKKVKSNGWFYAGGGIGYIPYEEQDGEKTQKGTDPQGNPTYTGAWKLARMDFNKNTVTDLEVPENLWLSQYQMATVRNGKFYIALSPEVGGKGNIYIFDVNSASPKGSLGASIETGADQRYIGIF